MRFGLIKYACVISIECIKTPTNSKKPPTDNQWVVFLGLIDY
ncbi:hypothetical protein AO364_0700 [Moraxella catarrhalis]|nr:hypothetical protein AO364_0700 [Moraxella catarrhalis]